MISFATIAMYLMMACFDLAVLAGTVWLIATQAWSPWWMLLALCIISASSPRRLILAMHGIDVEDVS